jgi:tetratricopeptide (TPR) repeat protein
VSVRVGGVIIFLYLLLFFILWLIVNRDQSPFSSNRRKTLLRLFLQAFALVVIAYFGGLLFWPYALINPITHPLESLSLMEHYSISIRQLFQGSWFWSTDLPDKYLFTWMLISIPELVLLGLVLYAGTLFHKRVSLSLNEFMVFFFLFFPLFYVVLIDSNLYSGWRQMYFVSGPLSIISALGLERIYKTYSGRKVITTALLTVFLLAASLPVIHYWQNPGTAYIYFNSISGGNKKAWSNYEYDYYWHGMKKAVEWFDENIEEDEIPKIVASNFDISVYLKHRSDISVKYVHFDNRSTVNWEYGVFGINYVNPYQLKNNRWQPDTISKIITDHNHPLAVITKPLNRDDFIGVSMAEKERYPEAIDVLEDVIRTDSNNFILFEYLAESYYRLGQAEDCLRIIEQGKALHPWSEKLNMLEAQMDYDRGNFKSALENTLKVLKNNNKYVNIVPLLIACYEKTGQEGKALELKRKFDLP